MDALMTSVTQCNAIGYFFPDGPVAPVFVAGVVNLEPAPGMARYAAVAIQPQANRPDHHPPAP